MASDYNYSSGQFQFEKDYDHLAGVAWMDRNWRWTFWFSALYIIFVHAGKRYMEERPKFEIRTRLAIWSAVLAFFSICGAIRTIPELIYYINEYGLDSTVCKVGIFDGPLGFWTFLFALSKLLELGDTVFIVLRKQKLVFLHWYHHVTVLCYSWYSYAGNTAPGCWFTVLNFTVHSFMYTYYTFKALRFNIPRRINIFITILQIFQMFVGVGINLRSYVIKSSGRECLQSWENLTCGLLMYFSYLVLFSRFFYDTYMKKGGTVHEKQPQSAAQIDKSVQNGIKHAQNRTVVHRVKKKE